MTGTTHRQEGLSLVTSMILILVVAGLLFAAYIWAMLQWSYSSGERAGWVQKLSDKGYICKTWEGEMALVSLPGSMPEKFIFTVWDDKAAEKPTLLWENACRSTMSSILGFPRPASETLATS